MPGDASVELAALGRRLKAASNGAALRRELLRGIRAGAAPLTRAVQDAAREKLPRGGGLNEQVAGQRVSVRVALAGRNTGVRLTTSAPDTAQTDSGYVRHPVYGRRAKWVHQDIPQAAGWWSQTLQDRSPEITPEVIAAMERVLKQITLIDRLKYRFRG